MFHLTLFGGTEGEMAVEGTTALTLFGGTELRLPTLAQRLAHRKARAAAPRGAFHRWFGLDRNLVVTLFGGTELQRPTLAQEYAALRQSIESGVLTREDVERHVEAVLRSGTENEEYTSIAIFGACTRSDPEPKEEKAALESTREAGLLDADLVRRMTTWIGAPWTLRMRGVASLV